MTISPGTFEHNGSPFYYFAIDEDMGFCVYESESGIDDNDRVLLVIHMSLDITYADVCLVYDAFTLLQDNAAYECFSSWQISEDGILGLKSSASLLPLIEMNTLNLQEHVFETMILIGARANEFYFGLNAAFEDGNFAETKNPFKVPKSFFR
jgi:hypothetical protein